MKKAGPDVTKRQAAKPAGISEKVIRLLEIYTMIAQKQFPSVQSLKEHFNVSERSVYRYLEIINMIDGIEFDQERKGYTFTTGDRIKKLTLSDNELLVLFAASEAVSHLGEPLGHGFQELMNRATAATKKAGAGVKIPIAVKIPEAVGSRKLGDYFAVISTCLNERRTIELVYRAQATKEITDRLVDPYGLVFYDGIWTLIGYCHLRKGIRTFAFDRILGVKERYLYFKPKDDFDLEEYLSHSWGIVDDEEVKVKVRFSAEAADYVLRKKWHPSEQREMLPNGGVELTYTVAGVDEIKHWIYSWLPNVEIIEPIWFREQAAEELAQAQERHTSASEESTAGGDL
jgi:predicted DNA-binding transcriptional regulator YafY